MGVSPSIVLLGVVSPLLLVSLIFADRPWGEALLVFLAMLFPAALIWLGLGRRARGSAWFLCLLVALLTLSGLGLLAATWADEQPSWVDWPISALILLLGLWILPLVLVLVVFVATFESWVLSRGDLAELRRRRS